MEEVSEQVEGDGPGFPEPEPSEAPTADTAVGRLAPRRARAGLKPPMRPMANSAAVRSANSFTAMVQEWPAALWAAILATLASNTAWRRGSLLGASWHEFVAGEGAR
jgi:hypothetical protein